MNTVQKTVLSVCIIFFVGAWQIAHAQDTEADDNDAAKNELINKVAQAYGGEVLTALENYQLEDAFINITSGQSHHPSKVDTNRSAQILLMDLKNNRAAYESVFRGRGGINHTGVVVNGETASRFDFQQRVFGAAPQTNPKIFAGGTFRTSDFALVLHLLANRTEAILGEKSMFINRAHQVISVPFPSSPAVNLYVDLDTHLISKMVRVNPQFGDLDYVFSDYEVTDGARYASRISFSIDGAATALSTHHKLMINQTIEESRFSVPTGFKAEDERIDDSKLVINKLSDKAYHIGQNGAYSLFVDTGSKLVAIGAYAGLQNRVAEFHKARDEYQPLDYQVVTHHHADHIGGLGDAVAAGMTIVTVAEDKDTILNSLGEQADAAQLIMVNQRMTLGSGRERLEIYDISTAHAANFLLSYHPATKTIFSADHFGTPFKNATPLAGQSTVDLLTSIESLNLDIRNIVTAHGARVFSIKHLRDSVAAHVPAKCPAERAICAL